MLRIRPPRSRISLLKPAAQELQSVGPSRRNLARGFRRAAAIDRSTDGGSRETTNDISKDEDAGDTTERVSKPRQPERIWLLIPLGRVRLGRIPSWTGSIRNCKRGRWLSGKISRLSWTARRRSHRAQVCRDSATGALYYNADTKKHFYSLHSKTR